MTFSASGRSFRARAEPQAPEQRFAVVDVPPPVDRYVFHRERPRAAVLHCAVLAAGLRKLHARRRDPANIARNLDRSGLTQDFSSCAAVEQTTRGLRQLRIALEPLTCMAAEAHHPAGAARFRHPLRWSSRP